MDIRFVVEGEPISKGSAQAQLIPPKLEEFDLFCNEVRTADGWKDKCAALRKWVRTTVYPVKKTKLRPWEQLIWYTAKQHMAGRSPTDEAVNVDLTFYLARPKAHYRTGKFSHLLKDSAPIDPAKKPDLDKLTRAVLDGLTKAAYVDDAQVCRQAIEKAYCNKEYPEPCVVIRVRTRHTDDVDRNLFDLAEQESAPF